MAFRTRVLIIVAIILVTIIGLVVYFSNGKHENLNDFAQVIPPRSTQAPVLVGNIAKLAFPHDLRFAGNISSFDILVVGAGLSGTVLADLYARLHGKKVLVLERRPHIGGNCFDFVEPRTGILANMYGAHLFHTSKEHVWKYVHRFGEPWVPYEHRVVGRVDGKLVPIPVNIDTVNLLFDANIQSVDEMDSWIGKEREASGVKMDVPASNSQTIGVERVGERLYSKLFHEYTKKQWDVFPEQLQPEVLSRIPVRNDWDDRYFPNDPHQALPPDGYTKWFEQVLDHPNITVLTNADYYEVVKHHPDVKDKNFEKVFFSGQIDQYLQKIQSLDVEPLQYRSIKFDAIVHDTDTVAQAMFVENYPQFASGNFTRAIEYKHMYRQRSNHSLVVREYSTDEGEPYYPFPTLKNQQIFAAYQKLAKQEEKNKNVHFVGRLANYKYFNMDDAIDNALELYRRLEGSHLIDRILHEVPMPDNSKMIVHFVVAVFNEDLSWMGDLCSHEWLAQPHVEARWFFYNKNELHKDTIEHQINMIWARHGCPALVAQKNLFIANLPNLGREGLTWLTYMFENDFQYGNANVFLQGATHSQVSTIIKGLRLVEKHLFFEHATRASQPRISQRNIRNV